MSAALQQKPDVKIKMTVVKGPHSGQVFQLTKSSFTLGRGPENDIVLMNDPQISRTHARVYVIDRDLEIANLSQKNTIIVDGVSVQQWNLMLSMIWAKPWCRFRLKKLLFYQLNQS
jgi:hypothetical protein